METKYSTPQITLTNLLVGPPPLPTDNSQDPDASQQLDNEDDVYRGSHLRSPNLPGSGLQTSFSPAARPESSASSSSSGTGFNIIPSVIEHAITRWARGRGLRRRDSGDSSSSSSSSTSNSSSSATSGPRRTRKKSPASLLSRTTSLTTRRQARAMSRAAPREFLFFLPQHLSLSVPPAALGEKVDVSEYLSRRELKTSSLKLVLAQLGIALKQNAKSNRQSRQGIPNGVTRDLSRITAQTPSAHLAADRQQGRNGPHVVFNVPPDEAKSHVHKSSREIRNRRGKPREVARQFFLQEKAENLAPDQQPCWWLDIASPTWDDMRALGKLLQLHPLTLEDILQKESREKFELFPRLGYYFVVFRAVERPQPGAIPHDDDDSCISEDGVGELTEVLDVANVYLVVFKEGICTFHFEDISLHMDSVRRKVLQLEGTMPMGSNWIAHGLMDSIVDAFFPILKDIQKEVLLVEDFVSGLDDYNRDNEDSNLFDPSGSGTEIVVSDPRTLVNEERQMDEKSEKPQHEAMSINSQKKEKKASVSWGRKLIRWWRKFHSGKRSNSTLARDVNRLRRMTVTRRLVTTLGRLLSAKLEVIAQIRKRLNDQGEVAIYLGDVQDHIISLNQSLNHYERMLSHSHPAYVSHLRFSLSEAKGGLDKALMLLTLVGLVVLCSQIVASLGGMNVNIPRSDDFHLFGLFLGIAVFLSSLLLGLARYWYVKAHGGVGRIEEVQQ